MPTVVSTDTFSRSSNNSSGCQNTASSSQGTRCLTPPPRDILVCNPYLGGTTSSSSPFSPLHSPRSILSSLTTPTTATPQRKHVHFGQSVQVREYAVTVGDVPIAKDSCPLTLDGPICRSYTRELQVMGSQQQQQSRRFRRLTLHQRRARIEQVQGWPLKAIRALELERIAELLEEAVDQQEANEKRQVQQLREIMTAQEQDYNDDTKEHLYPFSEHASKLFRSNREWIPVCSSSTASSRELTRISKQLEREVLRWACEHVLESTQAVLDQHQQALKDVP